MLTTELSASATFKGHVGTHKMAAPFSICLHTSLLNGTVLKQPGSHSGWRLLELTRLALSIQEIYPDSP